MTTLFPRPRLVVSRCLGFEPVRYNGQIIRDDLVQKLAGLCEPVIVCPEVEIGLGVPRPPIRLVRKRDQGLALLQPATGRDLTVAMAEFAAGFLGGVGAPEGFLLKSRSPSCGLRDVKVWGTEKEGPPVGKEAGAFGKQVGDRFPFAAIEDEGRLNDDGLRERFLTLLFALARLREVERSGERSALVDFHACHKYLLLAYEERGMRELGRIVAAVAERPWAETVTLYRERFAGAFARPARVVAHINVLQHAFGHVSEGLSSPERAYFLDQLGELRAGRLPLVGTLTLLRSWVLRFDADYVHRQTYLEPYPRELVG